MLTQAELRSAFVYKDDGHLYIKRKLPHRKIGDRLTRTVIDGYLCASFDYKNYKEHRLIWVYHNGEIPPGMQIDHINGERADNRIENIRLVTTGENQKNKRRSSRNTSGCTGVVWRPEREKWQVTISNNGTEFNIGNFYCKDDAITARKAFERFLGFHPNHGDRPAVGTCYTSKSHNS